MEEEIDLRQYIDVLLRWWWMIVLGTLLAGGSAFLVSMIMPPTYEATAGLVMLKSRAELSLGSGFQSLTDEDMTFGEAAQGQVVLERARQRLNSLAGMVKNGAIAQQVVDELSDILDEDERDPAQLIGSIEGEVLEDSDTIQITASHRDPVKAAAISNAWAQAFETHVNSIYGEAPFTPFADIHEQVLETRAGYDQAQEALLAFLSADDRISELQRQIEEEEKTIASLRAGRQSAISAVIDKEVEVKQRLISAYLEDDTVNRLFAFNKGQEAKRQILGTWIDAEVTNRIAAINRDRDTRLRLFNTSVAAEIDSRMRVFEHQRDELLRKLEIAYTRKHRLEDLIIEARLMREQLIKGGEASARSNGLALLSFKSKVFAGGQPFGTLDLQLPSVDALNPSWSAVEQIADLNGLIAAMEEEIVALDASIQEQSEAMLNGEGYQFLDLLSPEYLAVASSQTRLVTVTNGITATVTVSTSLSDFIVQRYNDLFDMGELALSAKKVAIDTPLFAEIESFYPELFTRDAWMQLAESVPANTELSNLATQMAEELLNMQGWEELLSYSVLDAPLSHEIVQRESAVRSFQAEISGLNQIKTDLQLDRDLAWSAYNNLLSKEQELKIATASEGTEVRFASPVLPPNKPISPRKMMNTAVGLALGL
ncbi:MAG: Wzz/FepE/Etk N-terminal domain-containing protein, partial [Anaerolineae bacterium]